MPTATMPPKGNPPENNLDKTEKGYGITKDSVQKEDGAKDGAKDKEQNKIELTARQISIINLIKANPKITLDNIAN